MSNKGLRFGGKEVNGRFLFELTGGAPALDLVNTLDERRTVAPIERLRDFAVLVDWSMQAGVVSSHEAKALLARARRNPSLVTDVLERALALRELFFEMVQALVAREPLPRTCLNKLNERIHEASRHRRLVTNDAGLTWSCGDASTDAEVILWRLIDSAASIFGSNDLSNRLRVCGGPTCAWAFLDFSRKQNRRWCDMSVCGNRVKARRHYKRVSTATKDPSRRLSALKPQRRRQGTGRVRNPHGRNQP